ncbi:MAG TPA: hypothetical protein VN203_03175 [Candidatus Acidoferrum sp.]|nr:hypothetical protein [Candidatus Acidoferrum sp.]
MLDKLVDLLRGRGMLIFWTVLIISIALVLLFGPLYGLGFAVVCFVALGAIDRYARGKAQKSKNKSRYSR